VRGDTDSTDLGQISCGGHENLQKTGKARQEQTFAPVAAERLERPLKIIAFRKLAAGHRPIDKSA
jgi:hypothetical protein